MRKIDYGRSKPRGSASRERSSGEKENRSSSTVDRILASLDFESFKNTFAMLYSFLSFRRVFLFFIFEFRYI